MTQKEQALEFVTLLVSQYPFAAIRESLASVIDRAESEPPTGQADNSIDEELYDALDDLVYRLKAVEVSLARVEKVKNNP